MQSSILLTDLLTVNCAFNLFLTPPPYPEGRPIPEALEEVTNFRVGYVMYPTRCSIVPRRGQRDCRQGAREHEPSHLVPHSSTSGVLPG